MALKFTNNASSVLAGAINSVVTSLSVASGAGALFPTLGGGDYFYCTLSDAATGNIIEIIKVTARSSDTFTIVRGQEGTSGQSYSAGDKVQLRLTAASLNNFPKLDENNVFTGTNTIPGKANSGANSDITSFSNNLVFSGDLTLSGSSIVLSEGASVTAAATTDIWATDGNTRHVTGNTTITSFGTAPQVGARMKLIFDGTPQLTQGTDLNLNAGGSNITIEAGDWAEVYADTTTQFDVVVHRKSGAPITNTSGFPAGTRMTFNQTAAPTGWTKDTTAALNDSIMRIVTGTVGSGGTTAFSTFNSQTSTGAHTLTLAQIPAHTHSMSIGGTILGNAGSTPTNVPFGTTNTGSAGSGASHSHTMTTSIKYNDFIIASKD